MRNVSLLSFAVVIALLACKGKQEGRPAAGDVLREPGLSNDKRSSSFRGIVTDIAKDNVLMGSAVGIAGSRPEQWDRYVALRSMATDAELLALTSDTNTVVRCYAFQALVERNTIDLFPVALRHLSDTAAVHTLYGCLGGSQKVGDFMLGKISPRRSQDGNYVMSRSQWTIIDSLLLYENDNRLEARERLLITMKPLKEYYIPVRRLVTEEYNKTAIVALSKYRKQQDIFLIKELLNDANSQELGFGAVTNFPDRSFYPFLEKALKDKIENSRDDGLQELYYAIVQYKDEASRQLLKYALSEAKDMQYIYHSDCLSQALREYPAKIYEGIVKPVYTGRPLR
jgi:hypothetical protein